MGDIPTTSNATPPPADETETEQPDEETSDPHPLPQGGPPTNPSQGIIEGNRPIPRQT